MVYNFCFGVQQASGIENISIYIPNKIFLARGRGAGTHMVGFQQRQWDDKLVKENTSLIQIISLKEHEVIPLLYVEHNERKHK